MFGIHGLHRGAARAMLALEEKFGLVSYLVDAVLSRLDSVVGAGLANLPLERVERALKQVIATYLGTAEQDDGNGLLAYVLRRARGALMPPIEACLLTAYRQAQDENGAGGGVSLAKVRENALSALSERLSEIVISPLNKQLALLMTLYVLLAGGWWFWLALLIVATGKLSGH